MNEQNNKVNSQQNVAPTNWSSGPAQNIQSQLMQNSGASDLSNVGSATATTYQASNKVISWGVGGKSTNSTVSGEIESLFDDDMLNQVNGTISSNTETEVLDESFLEPKPSIKNFAPIEQPKPKNFAPIEQPKPQNFQAPTGQNLNQSQQPDNMLGSYVPPGTDWMNNQPLSGGKLGLNTIDASASAKDVNEKGKFFSGSPFNKKKVLAKKPNFAPPVQHNAVIEETLPDIDESKLVANFLRYEYTKINMSVFSFSAFLFKGAFFINKKIYLLGLIIYALEFYILTRLSLTVSIIAYLVLSLVIALIANPLYLAYARAKVKLIRKTKKNRKKNQYELNKVCSKKGGTNFILAFLTLIIFYGGLGYVSMYELPNSTIRKSYDIIYKYIEDLKKPVYDGMIDRLSYDVENNLNITIPDSFKKEPGSIYKYLYSPDGKEEPKTCSLTISLIGKFTNPEDYLFQYKEYEKIEGDITELKRSSLTWYTLTQERKNYTKKMNTTLINNNVILLEYNSGTEVPEGVCENYYNDIFNSISLKEK